MIARLPWPDCSSTFRATGHLENVGSDVADRADAVSGADPERRKHTCLADETARLLSRKEAREGVRNIVTSYRTFRRSHYV